MKGKRKKPIPRIIWGMGFDGTSSTSFQQSAKPELDDVTTTQAFSAHAVNPTGF